MDRVLIAGTHSGCGKTTVTAGLLCALKKRGLKVSAFKCGPDYIDPMFHREAIGLPSYNLDAFFMDEIRLRQHLRSHAGEISVIEGVMGYYDGIGPEGHAGTYSVARATRSPAILVVNARGMHASAGAVISGFLSFKEHSNILGVIFNGASGSACAGLKDIARRAGVEPLGFLPRLQELNIASRHLGLVAAGELEDIRGKLRKLGELAERHIDLDGVLSIAGSAPALCEAPPKFAPVENVRIAVAADRAFCFMYRENIELLEALGARIAYFSPLSDRRLPEGIGGLYLCGGYPELHVQTLSANAGMRNSVKAAVEGGLPTIAECGGFLYLHQALDGFPMAGVIKGQARRTDKLQRFGYAALSANSDNLLCQKGESIPVHEFHYCESTDEGCGFTAKKAGRELEYPCVHTSGTLYAGFPHLYLPANPAFAGAFVRKAAQYAARNNS